ncbi:MAG TPA: response regulator transcription factor [Jatrophihabitans sp.]|nr:response regulator transcription factor [Jatrophihabitans sp.]
MSGTRPIRLVVADDHTLFRQGLVEMVTAHGDFEVVAQAATGPEAVSLAGRHRPDIVLLDVEMPGRGAGATVAELARLHPEVKTVILTMHEDAGLLRELLESGAAGYLVKTIDRLELLAGLRATFRGDTVTLSMSRDTLQQLYGRRPADTVLSQRELEVLRLATQALTNSQIASRLYIAEATVKRHLTSIYAKLGAVSRVDAIRKAIAGGVL